MLQYKVAPAAPSGPFAAVDLERFYRPANKRNPSSGVLSNFYDTSREAQDLADWLNQRAAGYPRLKQFEGGANWPFVTAYQRCALWAAR